LIRRTLILPALSILPVNVQQATALIPSLCRVRGRLRRRTLDIQGLRLAIRGRSIPVVDVAVGIPPFVDPGGRTPWR